MRRPASNGTSTPLGELETTNRVPKHAQYEAFSSELADDGVRVRNESHAVPADSEQLLGRGGSDSLWGGRPDIVLERFEESPSGEWDLAHVFLGEIKYTQRLDHVATGSCELLEHMAFVEHDTPTGEYVGAPDDVLDSVNLRGLFVDELDTKTMSSDEISTIQYLRDVGHVP